MPALLVFNILLSVMAITVSGNSGKPQLAVTLNVGLYPYVPRIEQFKEVFKAKWQDPDIQVSFDENWDGGYDKDPTTGNLDVVVFDAIFLEYFAQQGFLKEIPESKIINIEDLDDYAKKALMFEEKYYAIPQIGCTNLLFYRADDGEIEGANTVKSLAELLGECTVHGVKPPPKEGLMIDLSGGTTCSTNYLDAVMDFTGKYNDTPTLPSPEELREKPMSNLQKLVKMAGVEHANTPDYEIMSDNVAVGRAKWFADGIGRATVGFTEALNTMGSQAGNVRFKILPLANRESLIDLFFTDGVGISSNIADGKVEAAIKVANFLSSSEFLVEAFGGWTMGNEIPQYLLPVRKSVLSRLAELDGTGTYGRIKQIFDETSPEPLRLGVGSRTWLDQYKKEIQQLVVPANACTPNTCSADDRSSCKN